MGSTGSAAQNVDNTSSHGCVNKIVNHGPIVCFLLILFFPRDTAQQKVGINADISHNIAAQVGNIYVLNT